MHFIDLQLFIGLIPLIGVLAAGMHVGIVVKFKTFRIKFQKVQDKNDVRKSS